MIFGKEIPHLFTKLVEIESFIFGKKFEFYLIVAFIGLG
jgi:hypothetical protein